MHLKNEHRYLSLVTAFAVLLVVAFAAIDIAFGHSGPLYLYPRWLSDSLLYIPGIVAVVALLRLAYLSVFCKRNFPFRDSWLVPVSVISLYLILIIWNAIHPFYVI